jgi:DNA-binding CsgD family transcriptional regulator/tetratricopeptide (TPR) repeat protein
MGRVPAVVEPPRLLGRQAELEVVLARAGEAAAGRPGILLITGDAGVGKSRLAGEACERLDAEPFRVAVGGCVDIPGVEHAQLPFGPFMEALRQLRAALSAESRSAGAGTAPTPVPETAATGIDTWLRPRFPAAGTADPVHDRFEELLTLLEALTADQPLLLVLEDLHFADRSSIALLVFLARNLTRERVLVVGTARADAMRADLVAENSPFAAAAEHLVRLPGVDHLELGPLPTDAIRDLVRTLTPMPRSPEAIESIVDRAEGNTLVACELAGHDVDDPGTALPRTLSSSVRDRLLRAPREARAALGAAAVLGHQTDHTLLVELVATLLPEATTSMRAAAVDAAAATGLLVPVGDGYRFRHGLDREVIYEELGPGQRRSLHAAAADALSAAAVAGTYPGGAPADLAAEIATHYLHSGDRGAAHRSALEAARAAAEVSAFPEALKQFEHALRLWPRPGTDPETPEPPGCAMLTEAAEAARHAGEPQRGIDLLERAVAAPGRAADVALAWTRLAWFRREVGDGDGAMTAYERAIAVVGDDRESAAAAYVLATHATALMLAARFAAARERAIEAIAVARRALAPVPEANALITLGVVEASTGDSAGGLQHLARAKDILLTAGGDEERWRYTANMTYILLNLGRTEEAVEVSLSAIREVASRRSFPPAGVTAVTNAATGLMDLGRWDEAEALVADALDRRPPPGLAANLVGCQAEVAVLRGDAATAARAVPEAHRLAATTLEPDDLALACRVRAEERLWHGDVPGARAAVDEALAAVVGAEDTETVLTLLTAGLRIEADAAGVPGLAAPDRVAELARRLDAVQADGEELLPHSRLQEVLCRVELARARGEADATAWREVADHAQRLHRPYREAYARFRQGEADLAERRRPAATTSLRAALDIARRLRAEPLAEAITALATRGRLDVEAAPKPAARAALPERAAARGLTAREVEVLRLVVEGATNRVIARHLGMSEKTASVHVSRIITKLGAANRGEAAAAALRLRLLNGDTAD